MPLRFGTWHGDLVPWNLARLGRRLYAWDWESSTPDAPLGFDAVHFHFQVEFVARGLPLGQAVPVAARHAAPALAELGLTAPGCGLLVVLHLIELFLRHEEARGSSGEADDRFYPAVIEVLDHELRQRASAPDTAGRAA
jgi:hypothetical protein